MDDIKTTKSVIERYHQKVSSTLLSLNPTSIVPLISDMLDEACIYVERTIQLIWLMHECGLFEGKTMPDNETVKYRLMQLSHRLRMSSVLVLQLCQDEKLQVFLASLN